MAEVVVNVRAVGMKAVYTVLADRVEELADLIDRDPGSIADRVAKMREWAMESRAMAAAVNDEKEQHDASRPTA